MAKTQVTKIELPGQLLTTRTLASGDNWLAATKRACGRLHAGFLIAEDPQLRLDARKAATLMHQVSLVEHILKEPNLRKVLIGDEVGLGKTIEAGLLIQALTRNNPLLRILYLAPARLVRNVASDLCNKLGINNARLWIAGAANNARLEEDRIVIASIHKAVYGNNSKIICDSGPWDVVIVDECHHLSDWGANGGEGDANQSFNLVRALVKGQSPNGRLILMSGTPHQGSEARFNNILRLLSDDFQNIQGATGRVIFRTKDRVSDWNGNPLFPLRDVRPPVLVNLGQPYRDWCSAIGDLYAAPVTGSNARMRAAGWAKGMALQWSASSVQAGLGFLVRLAIRRLGWTLKNPSLKKALGQLRPYRGGAKNESLEDLYKRIVKQIGDNAQEQTNSDEDKVDAAQWAPDPDALADLLVKGVNLIAGGADLAKWEAVCKLIKDADAEAAKKEKIVFFAQPVETVTIFAAFLKDKYPGYDDPSIIIGDQTDAERMAQVNRFQDEDGPRFLVSSRAGSEGLNMQCASRLVHLDVPWNPMQLEQRIGRIHRVGSRRTVVIHTVVADGSREVEMYRVAQASLLRIAQNLDPSAFANLFSRVMSLVPPKDLEDILGGIGNLTVGAQAQKIGTLVQAGYQSWNNFNSSYSVQIAAPNPSQAQWADVGSFLEVYHGATNQAKATFNGLVYQNGQMVDDKQYVPTISFKGQLYACGDTGGLTTMSAASSVAQLGLNLPVVRQALHDFFSPGQDTGAAFVTRPLAGLQFLGPRNETVIVLAFMQQTVQPAKGGLWIEQATTLRMYVLGAQVGSAEAPMREEEGAELIRELKSMTRIKDPTAVPIRSDLVDIEEKLLLSLQVPSPDDIAEGRMHAVWPIAAIALHP